MVKIDVAYEQHFRELVNYGYHVVVECLETPVQRAGVFHGIWSIRAMSADGQTEKVLVAARKGPEGPRPRHYKTLAGFVAFLVDLGFEVVSAPMVEGGRVHLNMANHGPKRR